MGKHAYLIMAHHRPDLLKMLIGAIDDSRNEIFVHIDKKANLDTFDLTTVNSKIHVLEQKNVIWGSYSQIDCEYDLFKMAYYNGPFDYYHLLTGVTYPLHSQNRIHDFFDANQGKEFIGFDEKNDFSFRARNIFLFNNIGKPDTYIKKVCFKLRKGFLVVQKIIGFNRLMLDRNLNTMQIKKGMAYVSVTNDFVGYLLEKENEVKKLLHGSISGDEIFVQTIAYNSEFREKIYDMKDEFNGCMREFAWDDALGGARDGHNFLMIDMDYLLSTEKMFGLKFEGTDGIELINKISDWIKYNET